jgi:hypothetical protein
MESELVAGLCELWLNFFLISKYRNQVANGHLVLYWAQLIKGWDTISWVLGLMQYRNNNLNNIIGIVSDLYRILIKYVDKIINPFNGNFCYKKRYYNLRYPIPDHPRDGDLVYLRLLDYKLCTWTSKIKDPSERYTPCIEIVSIENYMEIHNNHPFSALSGYKGLFLFYKSKPGNPIFDSLSLDAEYNKSNIWEYNFEIGQNRPIKSIVWDIYNTINKYKFKWKDLPTLVKGGLFKCVTLDYNLSLTERGEVKAKLVPAPVLSLSLPIGAYTGIRLKFRRILASLNNITVSYVEKCGTDTSNNKEGKIELETRLKLYSSKVKLNENKNLNSERIVFSKNKRIISGGNYSQNTLPVLCLKKNEGNINKVKRKITEKNKTKSRSNKWKYIISEKSRKHIILGCEGKTYLEKLENFYNSWWNYYIIRKCNTGEILYEYHSPIQNRIRILHSRFKPPYEEFPNKINEFLNYSEKFRNYYLEKRIGIINDNMIDECIELYLYFNNGLRVKDTNAKYFKLDYLHNNEPKYIESNIEQYYSFCNNINVYVGWVSIIRINNYSAQPTYYNNLIKRYHKEWINMLKYWVDVPYNNLKWNSNTKMNDTNLLAITTNKDAIIRPQFRRTPISAPVRRAGAYALPNPIEGGIGQNNNYDPLRDKGDTYKVETPEKLRRSSSLGNVPNLSDPFIPNKYQHKFNYVKITIKKIKYNSHLYNKYTKSKKKKNKLPWGIKESIMDHVEKNSKEFVKIWPKFK